MKFSIKKVEKPVLQNRVHISETIPQSSQYISCIEDNQCHTLPVDPPKLTLHTDDKLDALSRRAIDELTNGGVAFEYTKKRRILPSQNEDQTTCIPSATKPELNEDADFGEIKIEDFGEACLRSMYEMNGDATSAENIDLLNDYKDGDANGDATRTKHDSSSAAKKRPRLAGLGGKMPPSLLSQPHSASSLAELDDESQVASKCAKIGGFVQILLGEWNGFYGTIESLDESSGNCCVCLAFDKRGRSTNQSVDCVRCVSESEFRKSSKCLNNASFARQKEKEKQLQKSNATQEDGGETNIDENDHLKSRLRLAKLGSSILNPPPPAAHDTAASSSSRDASEKKLEKPAMFVCAGLLVSLQRRSGYKQGEFDGRTLEVMRRADEGGRSCSCYHLRSRAVLERVPTRKLEPLVQSSLEKLRDERRRIAIVIGEHAGKFGRILEISKDRKTLLVSARANQNADAADCLDHDDDDDESEQDIVVSIQLENIGELLRASKNA